MVKTQKRVINKREFFHNVGKNNDNCGNLVAAGFRACAKTPFFATIVVASFMRLIEKIIQQPNTSITLSTSSSGNYIDYDTGSLACVIFPSKGYDY